MPNVHLAPAEIRALLRLLTQTSTREGALMTATTKLGEALDAAQQRRENRQLDEHTAAALRRNREIEERNTELYQAWNDVEAAREAGRQSGQDFLDALDQDETQPTHCRNGHNKRLTRCRCDDQ